MRFLDRSSFVARFNGADSRSSLVTVAFMFALLLLSWHLQGTAYSFLATPIHMIVFCALAAVVFINPVWGIAIIVASHPVERIFPAVPVGTSFISVIGAIAFLGVVLRIFFSKPNRFESHIVHAVAAAFVFWIVASHPSTAFFSGGSEAIWSIVQLVILLVMTSYILTTPREVALVMGIFAAAAVVSALYSLPQVQFGPDSASSVRAYGLSGGKNAAAQYYTIAIAFLAYFIIRDNYRKNLLLYACIAVLCIGIASTVSRTGFLTAGLVCILWMLLPLSGTQGKRVALTLCVLGSFFLLIPSEYYQIIAGIPTSIARGTDSIGFRYMQWTAGFEIWRDHPIAGIGVGQFISSVPFYGLSFVPFHGLRYSPHSMYTGLLAETGLVGLILVLFVVAICVREFWNALYARQPEIRIIAAVWIIVFAVILFSGITGDEYMGKLLWMTMGISVSLNLMIKKESPHHVVQAFKENGNGRRATVPERAKGKRRAAFRESHLPSQGTGAQRR